MTYEFGEERSLIGETFRSFRERMVAKAIDEDRGILSYSLGDLSDIPPDYDHLADSLGIAEKSAPAICKYRFINAI